MKHRSTVICGCTLFRQLCPAPLINNHLAMKALSPTRILNQKLRNSRTRKITCKQLTLVHLCQRNVCSHSYAHYRSTTGTWQPQRFCWNTRKFAETKFFLLQTRTFCAHMESLSFLPMRFYTVSSTYDWLTTRLHSYAATSSCRTIK